jgi:hypothetical protein
MEATPRPADPQEPQPVPGVPLKPDPGYPETRGGTRDLGADHDE